MSKQVYSVPRFWLKESGVKKEDLIKNFDKLRVYSRDSISVMNNLSNDEKINQVCIYDDAFIAWRSILIGSALHVFIETKELFDFLLSQEIKDINISMRFGKSQSHELLDGELYDFNAKTIKSVDVNCTTVIIHHKNFNIPSYVYCIKWYKDGNDDKLSSFYVEDAEGPLRLYTEDNKEANSPPARLLYNTLFYREAFPDCIKDGTPDEAKAFNSYYGAKDRIKLTAHESLLDRSGITPHFRRGYFKRLRSEYFKGKRGQVIFVRSTFVKGRAETVLDSKDACEEMASL